MSGDEDRRAARDGAARALADSDQVYARLADDDELVDRLLAVARSTRDCLLTMREERGIGRANAFGLLVGILLAAADDVMPDPERAP